MLIKDQQGAFFASGGDDENALTGALAQCIAHSERLLRMVLRNVGLKNVRAPNLQSARVFYQRHVEDRKEGITDIEIEIPGILHVIIEAKIKAAFTDIEQCQKYLGRFSPTISRKRLAVLVDAADIGIIDEYRSRNPSF